MRRAMTVAAVAALSVLSAPVAFAEGEPVPLTLASSTGTATYSVPAADVELMRESLAGGYVNSELLGCYEHFDPERFSEAVDVTVCEPSAFVTAAIESGETSGLVATFEDVAYPVDLSVVQLDGDGGAVLSLDLPVTGVDDSGAAPAQSSGPGLGVKIGVVAAAVLAGLGGGAFALKRRR